MMNEPQNVQAAKQLARRSEDVPRSANVPRSENGSENVPGAETAKERAEWLFQTVTARLPDDREAAALLSLLQDTTVYYQQNPELASQLIGTSDAEQAAWTIVASTLLNLDEAISK
jgi:hypothetical protein